MFSAACAIYRPLSCRVGGGADIEQGRLFGSGCLVSPNHVLTARHVVNKLPRDLNWPVVLKFDGLFRCTVVWESTEHDLALVETGSLLESIQVPAPTEYPRWPNSVPDYGVSVGYIATPHLNDSTSATYFAQAAISMLLRGRPGLRYMLSDGIVQSGFSGCPVFSPNSELQGVIVESYPFPEYVDQQPVVLQTRPVMSAICPVLSAIRDVARP